jgi:flagellar capping protein FliD
MSANETSLLLRIRGDAAGGKAAVAETRAAVAQLRQSFGPELTQTVSGTNKVFSELGDNLNVFVSQRLPLVGGSFLRVTENIGGLGKETAKQEAALKKVSDSITGLSSATGKSVPQLTTFLTTFAKIEGQANRDAAAVKFFGAELLANNAKIIPSAEQAASGLAAMATSAEGAAVAAGGLALPIGIAVVAITALATGAALAAREIFQLTKNAAEFQGRMFDLAQQTGLAVETLSALEVLAKTTGGEVGSLTNSIVNFQRKLDDAQDPLSKTGKLFSDFGIATSDTETALRSAFAALAAMPEGFEQTNAAAELFGARGGKQILAILKETNGDLDGAIKRFREMGILIETDAARAADKFNDELALLDFQLRAASAVVAQELIPAFIDVIRVTGDLVRDLGPLLRLFSNLAGPVVRTVGQSMKGLGLIVAALTNDYKALADAIKESNDQATIFKDINPQAIPSQNAPGPFPVALPITSALGSARDAAQTADAVTAIVKRSAAEQKQILSQLFEQGRINRQQEAEGVIDNNKKVLDADKARIQAQLDLQEQQIKITQGRTDIPSLRSLRSSASPVRTFKNSSSSNSTRSRYSPPPHAKFARRRQRKPLTHGAMKRGMQLTF